MFDKDKIDSFFNTDEPVSPKSAPVEPAGKHSRYVRRAKLLFPSLAAILLGLLVLFPYIDDDARDFRLDITKPKRGELEKLHIENTTFYITDKDNKVHNFTASNIDETAPGSKLIKLTAPEGLMPVKINEWVNIKAPIGYFNQENNTLRLTENVDMFYNEGMNVNTPEVTFDFNQSKGYSDKPVTAQGEFGDLQSEGFEFSSKNDVLIFTGRTNILIKEEKLKGK